MALHPVHALAAVFMFCMQLCFFTVHWGACGFYYLAKQGGFSDMTWVGANMDWVGRGTAVDK